MGNRKYYELTLIVYLKFIVGQVLSIRDEIASQKNKKTIEEERSRVEEITTKAA